MSGHRLKQCVQVIVEFFLDFLRASHGRWYALMTVNYFLSDKQSQRVIWQSFSPLERPKSLGMRGVLTAKPTPDTWHSSAPPSLQKNMKPDPCSMRWPSPVKWVSLGSAFWIPYLSSSLATSSVLLSGWSACGLLRSVSTFNVQSTRGTTFEFFLCVQLQIWDLCQLPWAGQRRWGRQCLRHLL